MFRESVEEICFIKSEKNKGYVHEVLCTFMILSCSVLVTMRNVSEKNVVDKIKRFTFDDLFPIIVSCMS
jgi:hypothetical protein